MQPWEDATSCIFSGCYESGPEMQYRKYWIQNFTCSINRGEETAINVANGKYQIGSPEGAHKKEKSWLCV